MHTLNSLHAMNTCALFSRAHSMEGAWFMVPGMGLVAWCIICNVTARVTLAASTEGIHLSSSAHDLQS